jgi:hypothetical protein
MRSLVGTYNNIQISLGLVYGLLILVVIFSDIFIKKKGKIISVAGSGGPQGCHMSRIPHFLDSRLTDGSEVVSLMLQPPGRFLVVISVRG